MAVEGLSHITFIVQNFDKMENILITVLGAQKIYDSGNKTHSLSAERFYLVGRDEALIWIAVMAGESHLPRSYNHVAFKIPEHDYELKLAAILSLGLEVRPPRPRIAGEARSIYFYDYDNHLFELHTGTLSERLAHYEALLKAP